NNLGGNASYDGTTWTGPTYNVNGTSYTNVGDALDAATTHYYSVKSNDTGTNSNYDNKGATGTNALAAGPGAQAIGSDTVAVGHTSVADGNHAIAIGLNATATPNDTIAIGNGAQVGGTTSGYYHSIA